MSKRFALAVALTLALPSGAAAAGRITSADVDDFPTVRVTVVAASEGRAPVLAENGRRAPGQVAQNAADAKSVVLAIDRSQSMAGAALEHATAAARAFVAAKPQRDRVAIVGFGSTAVRLTRFSSAKIDADLALRTLSVDARQGTALYDAVALASQALVTERLPAKVLVLVTDGNDIASDAGLREALAAARRARVVVHAIGIEGPQFSPTPLRELASATGGAYHGARSADALAAVYRSVGATLRRTWQIEYLTQARRGDRLRLSVAGAATTLRVPGTPPPAPAAPSSLVPRSVYDAAWAPALLGLAVGSLALVAIAAIAGARRGSRLRNRLAPHVEARVRARHRGRASLGAAATLMQATERAFGAFRLWTRLQRLLERADVPLRTVEFVYVCLGSSLLLAMVATFVLSSALGVLAAFAGGAALPVAFLSFKAKRRAKAFEDQLPDILLTIASSLKAGHSFKQGLQTVADETDEPAGKEFQRVLSEIRLGRPVESALNEVAERLSSKNLAFVVTAVSVQTQVGGSLAGLFDMVADAVRRRQQFARKIRGLTAMGRASAYVLVGLPFALVGMIMLVASDFLDPLWNTSAGQMMIAMALTMMAIGSLILKKIVSFRG